MATIALVSLVNAGLGAGLLGAGEFGLGLELTAFGTAVVASAGSYIDQRFLFAPKAPVANDLNDIEFSGASEGNPLIRPFGSLVANSGSFIWISPVRKHRGQSSGGKGPGQSTQNTTYRMDFAVAFAETSLLPGGAIDSVVQVEFDGNVVWREQETFTVGPSTQLSSSIRVFNSEFQGGVLREFTVQRVNSPNGGPDLSIFDIGTLLDVNGFNDPVNNNIKKVWDCKKELDGTSWVEYGSKGELVGGTYKKGARAEAAGASVTLVQVRTVIPSGLANSFVFYKGNQTTEDPTISAFEQSVPQFRQSAYFVVNNLDIADYGNRPPSAIRVTYRPELNATTGTVLQQLMESAGLTNSVDFDVTLLTEPFNGVVQRGIASPDSAISEIMLAYDIVVQERGGVLVFLHRTELESVLIDSADLAAHELGNSDTMRSISFSDAGFRDAPRELIVTYLNVNEDLKKGSETYKLLNSSTTETSTVNLSLILRPEQAQCIARRILWEGVSEIISAKFQLPPSYMKVIENDILQVTEGDGTQLDIRAVKVDIGRNNVRIYSGREFSLSTTVFNEADCIVETPVPSSLVSFTKAPLLLTVLDVPSLDDAFLNAVGVYWCVAAFNDTAPFTGATLFTSTDGGLTYQEAGSTALKCILGLTLDSLPAPVTSVSTLDLVNSVTVELATGSLENKTVDEVLRGSNRAVVGNEILGFTTVTSLGNNQWKLEGLLRGLRDSEDQASLHQINDRFILVFDQALQFLHLDMSIKGDTISYKIVPEGETEADTDPVLEDSTLELNTLRPFSPGGLTIDRPTGFGGDQIFSWEFRTRAHYKGLSGKLLPQFEPDIIYEMDIYDSALPGKGTFRRTVLGLTSPTYNYTAAQQTADGASVALYVEVFQISTKVGRSKPLIGEL